MSLVLSSSNKALSVAIEENGEFHYYVTDLLNMSRLITSDSKEGSLAPRSSILLSTGRKDSDRLNFLF